MFFLACPNQKQVDNFLATQHDKPFSYVEVGATGTQAPAGFEADHNRIMLGKGENVFQLARAALVQWKMFDIGWVELCWKSAPIKPETTVGILAHHFGFHSLSAARIVYVIDEAGEIARFGFAYGTLKEHLECGEERFMVEWNRDDDSVWYDLFAFSRPQHPLLKLGYPVTRAMQKRFVRDSQVLMRNAVSGADGVTQ